MSEMITLDLLIFLGVVAVLYIAYRIRKWWKKGTSKLTISKTERGFALVDFRDRYGRPCSLQKSSLAFENCIWLGVDDGSRMHLTPEQVSALLPHLQKFVKTGDL